VWAGDSEEIVTPFVQVRTYLTRNFATFGPLELQPPFTGALVSMSKHLRLTFQHRAGVSLYTASFEFAKTCVFDKQSLLLILDGCGK
jgi:hypothetical protein